MLEHGTESDPEAPPPEGSNTPAPEGFYIPPGKPEPLTGRGKAPSVKRFNRKMLLLIAGVMAIVITLAFSVGLQHPKTTKTPQQETSNTTPTPNEAINALPGSYSDTVPQLGDPRPGDLSAVSANSLGAQSTPRQLTPLEQYIEQQELDRLRQEDAARAAGVSFVNAGGSDAALPSSSNAATGADLQERLLDLAQRGAPAAGPTAVATGTREEPDANGQDRKAEFADRVRAHDFELHARVEAPRSPNTLFAGTILPCVLTQGINSDLPGQIGCMISQNVFDTVTGRHLLLPQGTKAIGTYDSRVAYGQDRVLVVWTRLLRPDGSTLSLEGMPGTDLSGYAGLTGHVNNHYLRLLSGVILGSLIGAGAQIATGANSENPGFAALAAQGAGQNINEAGQQITRKNLNIQPTIEVRPGARLNIFTTKDLILPPWVE
jgi:type IV secretion system protein TrbI